LGGRHGRALEQQSARDALAGDGSGVRDVGWRRRAGAVAEAGDCYRCGLKLGEGILLQLSVAQDSAGSLKPKDKSTELIDGIVAIIMAIGRAMVAKEQYATTPMVVWV
jgi:phage terminase large subunit-like protein